MKDIEKIRDGLYIKKSFDGYRVVHPIRNDDDSWNLKNLFTGGSYWNWLKLAVVLLLIGGVTWSYFHDIEVCQELTARITSDPHGFCLNITTQQSSMPREIFNASKWEGIVVEEGEWES